MNEVVITQTLKKVLKSQGVTYNDLAQKLNMSEASIKRIFSESSFSLKRFIQICNILDIDFKDLVEMGHKKSENEVYEYTYEQEYFFSNNLNYLAYLDQLLSLKSPLQIIEKFKISKKSTYQYLNKLEDLGFLKRLPGDKVKLLIPTKVKWRKEGPLRKTLLEKAKKEFLMSQFLEPQETMRFTIFNISKNSALKIKARLFELLKEAQKEGEYDQVLKNKCEQHGLLLAFGSSQMIVARIKSKR